MTGAVIVILAAIAAANLGIIPHSAPAYDFVFRYLVPVLLPLFLMQANLRQLVKETARTTLAFLLACLGTVVGITVAALVLDLGGLGTAAIAPGRHESAIAGLFASTYTGGSVNYAALGEITGLREDASFFSAATAADNLFSAVYLGLLALMPGWHWLARRFAPHDHSRVISGNGDRPPVTATSLVLSLAAALAIVAVGDAITAWLALHDWRYVVITLLSLLLSIFMPNTARHLAGSFDLGVGLSFVFFAAIAAGANVPAMIQVAPLLLVLILILLSIHALVVFGLGLVLRLSLPELITASNAAIPGGHHRPGPGRRQGLEQHGHPRRTGRRTGLRPRHLPRHPHLQILAPHPIAQFPVPPHFLLKLCKIAQNVQR